MRPWWFVVGLLLLAAGLRTVGLAFGQPDPVLFPSYQELDTIHENLPIHPDEYSYTQRPLRMLLNRENNPDFYHNPPFLINVNYITFWLTGERARLGWDERADLSARSQAPFRLYFIGRVYAMLFGVLAVAAAYATARRIFGAYAAIVAGLLVAASMPLVQHSHYAKTSGIAATFSILTVWASFNCLVDRQFRWPMFALAGIFAGFAAGNRYDAAGISIVVFVTGWVLLWRERTRERFAHVLIGWLCFPAAFAFTTPWVIFDNVEFVEEVSYIMNLYTSEVTPFAVDPWPSMLYLYRYIAMFGLGIPAAVVTLIGFALAFRSWGRDERNTPLLFTGILLCYLVPYSLFVLRPAMTANSDQLTATSIPQFALLAGLGAAWLRGWLPRWLSPFLAVGLAVIPLIFSVQLARQFAVPDTRTQIQAWVYEHIPAGAHIHLNGPYNVPLDESLYAWTQNYGGQYPSVEDVAASGADYVILSDALYNLYRRSPAVYPDAFREEMETYVGSYYDQLSVIAHLNRPPIFGTNELVHTATYWHNPALTVFCVTPESCAAVRSLQ